MHSNHPPRPYVSHLGARRGCGCFLSYGARAPNWRQTLRTGGHNKAYSSMMICLPPQGTPPLTHTAADMAHSAHISTSSFHNQNYETLSRNALRYLSKANLIIADSK